MARLLAGVVVLGLGVETLFAAAPLSPAEPESFRYYAIGASFLNDHHPSRASSFSPWLGLDIDAGYHVRGGSTTTQILNNPTDSSTPAEPYGQFEHALPNYDWDALVVQVFPANGYGVADDVANLSYFAALMDSPQTPIYLYETWPWRYQVDDWALPLTDEFTQWRREYYHRVADELAPAIDNPVYIVPTGEVITTLARIAESGVFEGIDSLDNVYRDDLHASALAGSLLSAVTVGTVTGRSPIGSRPNSVFLDLLTPAELEAWDFLLAAVWQAAALELRSPVAPVEIGDYDADGQVDASDLAMLVDYSELLGTPDFGADIDGDGVLDATDYDEWLEVASETAAASLISPEPGALAILTLAISLGIGGRSRLPRRHADSGSTCRRHETVE